MPSKVLQEIFGTMVVFMETSPAAKDTEGCKIIYAFSLIEVSRER